MNPYYIGGGAVAALGAFYLISRGGGGSKKETESQSQGVGVGVGAPLFMATGGGTNAGPTNDPVLGGAPWEPLITPATQDPSVEIARINADVNKMAISSAEKIQLESFKIADTTPANTISTKSEYRGSSIVEGAAFVKDVYSRVQQIGPAMAEKTIYEAAKAKGYSATEVAQSMSDATGNKVTVDKVNEWLKARGLSL